MTWTEAIFRFNKREQRLILRRLHYRHAVNSITFDWLDLRGLCDSDSPPRRVMNIGVDDVGKQIHFAFSRRVSFHVWRDGARGHFAPPAERHFHLSFFVQRHFFLDSFPLLLFHVLRQLDWTTLKFGNIDFTWPKWIKIISAWRVVFHSRRAARCSLRNTTAGRRNESRLAVMQCLNERF